MELRTLGTGGAGGLERAADTGWYLWQQYRGLIVLGAAVTVGAVVTVAVGTGAGPAGPAYEAAAAGYPAPVRQTDGSVPALRDLPPRLLPAALDESAGPAPEPTQPVLEAVSLVLQDRSLAEPTAPGGARGAGPWAAGAVSGPPAAGSGGPVNRGSAPLGGAQSPAQPTPRDGGSPAEAGTRGQPPAPAPGRDGTASQAPQPTPERQGQGAGQSPSADRSPSPTPSPSRTRTQSSGTDERKAQPRPSSTPSDDQRSENRRPTRPPHDD